MKYTKQRRHDKGAPTRKHFRCDGCNRRKPSTQALVQGIYVYCRRCMKERRQRDKKKLDKSPASHL